jgi:hypothetical protein
MSKTVPALVLSCVLSVSPVFAGDLRDSAHAAATQAAGEPEHRGAMPPGLKWTGIGLLIAGGVTVLLGAAVKNDDSCGYRVSNDDCNAIGNGFYVFGGALAGTGAALLGVANAKREKLPSITIGRNRFGISKRITF